MKVTFPHMGNMYIPLKSLFEQLGVEVVVPPPTTKKTLDLGVKYSPEFACLPLKLTIGNFIEAFSLGANTIIMAGGIGPCRFGYYGEVQREILKGLGFEFEMIILEPPRGHFLDLMKQLRRIFNNKNCTLKAITASVQLAWQKALLLDEIDKIVSRVRPSELYPGDTDKVYQHIVNITDRAGNEMEIMDIKNGVRCMFEKIPRGSFNVLPKIGLVGEIYTILEPFSNLYIEKHLGELGAEVQRSIYITDWIRENLFPTFLRSKDHARMLDLAKPYINCFVGGHGQETVAETVRFSQEGYAGVIHILPFTCMPEIVAKSVLPQVSRESSIPVMTIVLDEHSAETGLRTRLEAFIDMIKFKLEAENYDEMLAGN